MHNHKVYVKIQPLLVKRKTAVVSNVRVIVSPSSNKSVRLEELKNNIKPNKADLPNRLLPPNAAVSQQPKRQANRVKQQSVIKYIRRDASPESLAKIRDLRNYGMNKVLLIIGNGPTVSDVDFEPIKGNDIIHTLSINKPDPRLWPTNHWVFFDQSQLRRHEDLWNGYNGFIFTSTGVKRQKSTSMQLKDLGGKGFSRDLTKGVHIGRSSVYASMQIALWMNYDYIYIFGCDMNPDGLNGRLHFYGTNPDVDPEIRKKRFPKEAEFYDYAADLLSQEDRQRFIFCSSENHWSFVNKYRRLDHKGAVSYILDAL